jgi:D-alanyl-D-alanine carboxypeptidase
VGAGHAVAGAAPPAVVPPARAMLLVDVDTGREIFGQHEHELLRPASLTKLLTALVADNWLPPTTLVRVSPRAAGVAPDKVGMKAGERWPLGITLHALLISSANDAAYALAEQTAGSVPRFATLMTSAAAQLGISDHPVLRDPAGLDGTEGAGGGNLLSAWDVAIAARALMANPDLAAIVRLTTYRFTGPDGIVYELASHNRAFLNSYPGAIGVKTGYTGPAGVCVAEEAVRNGRVMLAVVMNGVSPDATAALLLDRGFATPARAESRWPQLPAVHAPHPVPRAAAVRAVRRAPPSLPAPASVAAPTPIAPPHAGSRQPVAVGAVVGGAVVLGLGAGLGARWLVRRRGRHPAGV